MTGKSILLDDTEYSVSGVVKDVSAVTPSVYADMWVPYTSMPLVMGASDERDVSVGLLTVCILPADGMGVDEVSRELEEMIDRYNTTLADGKLSMMNGVETHLTHVIRQFVMGGSVTAVYLMLLFLIFLFLLIPALNLSGLNASRMQDRISELGVRKAFGARKNRAADADTDREPVADAAGRIGRAAGIVWDGGALSAVAAYAGYHCDGAGQCADGADSRDAAESGGVRLCLPGLLPVEPDVVDDPCLACDPCEYY